MLSLSSRIITVHCLKVSFGSGWQLGEYRPVGSQGRRRERWQVPQAVVIVSDVLSVYEESRCDRRAPAPTPARGAAPPA